VVAAAGTHQGLLVCSMIISEFDQALTDSCGAYRFVGLLLHLDLILIFEMATSRDMKDDFQETWHCSVCYDSPRAFHSYWKHRACWNRTRLLTRFG